MSKYQFYFTKSARKDLKKLPKKVAQRIFQKTDKLLENHFPHDSKYIKNSQDLYRVRVGAYRVIYQVKSSVKIVSIIRVGHRKDIYKKLSR